MNSLKRKNEKIEMMEDDDCKTLDLSVERGFAVPLQDNCGLAIGKFHGIGARSNQEDAFGISDVSKEQLEEKGVFLTVADGMGGMEKGENASVAAVVSWLQRFDQYEENGDLSMIEWLYSTALDVNDEVKAALGNDAGMGGCTLICVRIKDNLASWITIGDSHLYLYRAQELTLLNHDHVYAEKLKEMVEEGEISQESALNHPQRKALTSFLGINELVEIDGSKEPLSLQKDDWLLLMTDGVFGTLTEEEIVSVLQYPPGQAARRLSLEIEKKRKYNQDNYTGLLVKVLSDTQKE